MALLQPPIKFDHKARDWTDRQGLPIKKIVIHATAGTDSLSWLKGNPNGTSIHYLVKKDGLCYKMLDESKGANHVGFSRLVIDGVVYSQFSPHNCNQVSVGIELENLNTGKDMYPETQLRSAAWIIGKWLQEYHLQRNDVIMHRDCDTLGKSDARGITILDILRFLDEPPIMDSILNDSTPIIGKVHGTPDMAAASLTKHGTHASYTPNDHKVIAHAYWTQAATVGIDPLMAFAQMVHETGCLTSWWCLRDGLSPSKGRRNPAGIGVTGETSRIKPKSPDWQFDDTSKLWKRGYGFANWTEAVQAHLGHLLAYAVIPSQRSVAQRDMVAKDPRAIALPVAYRGIAKTWKDLNGRWAVPGQNYSTAIVKIANQILTQN